MQFWISGGVADHSEMARIGFGESLPADSCCESPMQPVMADARG
jgi:hypothetical protein